MQCLQIIFFANAVDDDGPFCPQTNSETGGMAIYDVPSATGLHPLNKMLFDIIEGDGFDMVYNQGNVNINDPSPSGSPPSPGKCYCLQASSDDDLELTYLIPVQPEMLNSPDNIETVEWFRIGLNGIPVNGPPPGIQSGPDCGSSSALMPALDPCGGHHDPTGYYLGI